MKQSTLALAILAALAFGSAGVLHAGDRAHEDQHTSGASDASAAQEGTSTSPDQSAQDDAAQPQGGTTADQAGSPASGATGDATSQPEPTDDNR